MITSKNPFSKIARSALALAGVILPRQLVPAALALCVALASVLPGVGQLALAQQVESAPAVQSVNINKADAQTIADSLNGVGTSRAEEIVRYRQAYGPFESIEELAEVKGIGLSTLDKNRKVITLD